MILVDTQIREKIKSCQLIENPIDSNIKSIHYDLRAEKFIEHDSGENHEHSEFELLPQQSIIVATKEIINLSDMMLGRVVGKNSRIREGLLIESPVYQPGHHTRIYFRLTNLSSSSIQLKTDHSYASIMFEQLDSTPNKTYDGTYQREFDYSYLGDYSSEYSKEISAVEKKLDNFKNIEKSIYANVITILTVFIAIFSIINVNIDFAQVGNSKWSNILLFNLCTVGSISLLADFILHHLSPDTFKQRFWFIPIACFLCAFICIFVL